MRLEYATVLPLVAALVVVAPVLLARADVGPLSTTSLAQRRTTFIAASARPSLTLTRAHSHTSSKTPSLAPNETFHGDTSRVNGRAAAAAEAGESNTLLLAWVIGFAWAALVLGVLVAVMTLRRLRAADKTNRKKNSNSDPPVPWRGTSGSPPPPVERLPGPGREASSALHAEVMPSTPDVWAHEGTSPLVVEINGQPAHDDTTDGILAIDTNNGFGETPQVLPVTSRRGSTCASQPVRRDSDDDDDFRWALPLPDAAINGYASRTAAPPCFAAH